jgi:hypothetical protein
MRAQKYAYHFFFRRMIPMPGFIRANLHCAPYAIAPLQSKVFASGRHAALDCVCCGILEGKSFTFDPD